MTDETKAKELHDRATHGKPLSLADQAKLQAWYIEQDQAEFQEIKLTVSNTETTELPNQIKVTLEQIAATTAQIQTLAVENEALRHTNFLLQRLVSPIKVDNFIPMARDEIYKERGEPR